VDTKDQTADLLTKALPRKQFVKLRELAMGNELLQAHFDRPAIAIRAVVQDC
jgi:hypothetical protein